MSNFIRSFLDILCDILYHYHKEQSRIKTQQREKYFSLGITENKRKLIRHFKNVSETDLGGIDLNLNTKRGIISLEEGGGSNE